MTMLTTEQLNAIKERAEKATAGPWSHEGNKWHDGYLIYSPAKRGFHNNGGTIAEIDDSYETYDAEFIAHAREDIPTLIAEVERLRKLAIGILEEYDLSESRYIREVSSSAGVLLKIHSAEIKEIKREINGEGGGADD